MVNAQTVNAQTVNAQTVNTQTLDSARLFQAIDEMLIAQWQPGFLSKDWRHWLIENKLLNVSGAALIEAMTRDGIAINVATHAVNLAETAFQTATQSLAAEPALPPVWQQWLLQNQTLKVSDQTLIQVLVSNGIDPQLAERSVQARHVQVMHHTQPAQRATDATSQLLAKLESILAVNRQLEQLSPHFGTIERREKISKQEFLERYYATSTPVIITGMMDNWPAMQQWCPEYIKNKYGEFEIEVQRGRDSDPNYEMNSPQHKHTVPMKEYVDWVTQGGETNDYYLVANNLFLERDEFKSLLDDIVFPDFLDGQKTRQQVFFWFGPAGTITPLHHDPVNVMMAHIVGRKRWRLISPNHTPLLYNHIGVYSKIDLENPDYETYPLFQQVNVIETILEPGEIIFVPVGWWHQVKGLDISLSVSFSNFAFPNHYDYQNPNIREAAPASQTQAQFATIADRPLTTTVATKDAEGALTYEGVNQNTTDGYLVDRIYPGQPLMISFGFVAWEGVPGFDFYGRSKKLETHLDRPLNRILLRDFENAWYHRGVRGLGGTIDAVCDRLRALIAEIQPSSIITVGQSMGGYAALLFGQLLGVDRILTFGPLSSLDLETHETLNDGRWLPTLNMLQAIPPEHRYFDLSKPLITDANAQPKIEIFYGQNPESDTPGNINLDDAHAHRLATLPNCTLHPYTESGHAIVKYLIDHQKLDHILAEYLFDTVM